MDKIALSKDLFLAYSFVITDNIQEYINKKELKCINEFEIINKIGEGAIWKVYLVNRYFYNDDNTIQTEQYAMKKTHLGTQLRRRYFKNEQMISYYDKVLNEIKIMGILLSNNSKDKDKDADNANVVKIQELIYSNSHQFLYIITEYYDVGPIMNRDNIKYNHYHNPKLVQCFDLNSSITLGYEDKVSDNGEENGLIKSQLLPLSFKHTMAKAIFKQIFAGIKYIHSKRIAHRDIKIENILFNSKDKKIKIIDYSISTILSNGETEINEPGGSMHYQAPELFSYDTKGYYEPFKADIWSIGICLYIFIYEQYPFDSDSELELQMKILNNDLYHPFNAENESFLLLLNRLLDKNPMTRLTDYDKILEMEYFN